MFGPLRVMGYGASLTVATVTTLTLVTMLASIQTARAVTSIHWARERLYLVDH